MKPTLIWILVVIIIGISLYQSIDFVEGFTTPTKSIVLLGDSVLKNNVYAKKGVDEILSESFKGDVVSNAVDGATIETTYMQLDDLADDLNRESTVCVLSTGGNNILIDYVKGGRPVDDLDHLNTVFVTYKILVSKVREKLSRAKIILLDIYYPKDEQYLKYYPLIRAWNKQIGEMDGVIKISEQMTRENDFAFKIEPSETGGRKIVNAILSAVK